MKKTIIAIFAVLLSVYFVGCSSSRVSDLRALTVGMSKEQVVQTIGLADRTLAVNATEEGLQEILEFRTYYNEVYAVEFVNDRLVGYEFLYDDGPTIVTGTMVPIYPIGYNRPIYHVQPNRPTHPNRPSRPSNTRPPSRPSESQPSRPSGSVGTTRPVEKPTQPVRPSTRPSTRDASEGN